MSGPQGILSIPGGGRATGWLAGSQAGGWVVGSWVLGGGRLDAGWQADAGRLFLWEPGNQVPTKCLSSSEIFGRIHELSRINSQFNRRMWAHKKYFLVARIDFLWQELISCGKNSFLMTIIDFLWEELSSFHKNQFFSWTFKINKTLLIQKIRFYKARAGPCIRLSQAKYFSPPWSWPCCFWFCLLFESFHWVPVVLFWSLY